MRCSTVRRAGTSRCPDDMVPGELPATLDDMLAHARTHAPMLAREQKMIERNDLASALARRDLYPDYTVSGGYFNQGVDAPDVAVPRGFQAARVLPHEAERGDYREGFCGDRGAAQL